MKKYKQTILTLEENVINELHGFGYNISAIVRNFLRNKLEKEKKRVD